MDIQFHYFAIKTLAVSSGFSEDEAQTIAHYSQQVDDFTSFLPMCVEGKPPEFFTENGFAKQIKGKLWMIVPHPTGIDVVQSLEEHYRHTTLAPFHFIPPRSFKEIEEEEGFSRLAYRCVCASDHEKAVLVNRIVEDAIGMVKESHCERNLMQLGMALHTYADTYAHCGYSGLDGWENKAMIKKAFNQSTKKEEVPGIERVFYKDLPHIGHGNSGHVPDICSYQIDVATLASEEDKEYSEHIERDNLESFLECSHCILDILCSASGTQSYSDDAWEEFRKKLACAMQVPTSEETLAKKEELAKHWKGYFPDVTYSYEKNGRFYQKENSILEDENGIVHHVTQAFYDYNELSYRRANEVLGAKERFEINRQLLAETIQNTGDISAGQTVSGLSKMAENRIADTWEPKTELGLAVHIAGFDYCPAKDILCSTMNNVQRSFGYCKCYDEAAAAVGTIIDCEPIYFIHNGYEWMLELWKGQYDIGTGCEIGLYYREADKPETELERTVTGKMYSCVPDDQRIDMSFSLYRNGQKLFERDWTKHWWLTGFFWGVFSQPEELVMSVGLRFPDEDMKRAFVDGAADTEQRKPGYGLKALGYDCQETDKCTVQFEFSVPHTKQPDIREEIKNIMQKINKEVVWAYNSIREKYHIECNDPDVIDEVLTKHAGILGKRVYEKLIMYFKRKAENKGF